MGLQIKHLVVLIALFALAPVDIGASADPVAAAKRVKPAPPAGRAEIEGIPIFAHLETSEGSLVVRLTSEIADHSASARFRVAVRESNPMDRMSRVARPPRTRAQETVLVELEEGRRLEQTLLFDNWTGVAKGSRLFVSMAQLRGPQGKRQRKAHQAASGDKAPRPGLVLRRL